MNATNRYMDFFLARHGETPWNKHREMKNPYGESVKGPIIQGSSDIELNETGLEQAEQLAQELTKSNRQFKKIFCSPLKRAATTAKIVARELKLNVIEDQNFAACSWGVCEGRTREYRTEHFGFDSNGNYRGPQWETLATHARWSFQPIPGAESIQSIINRMKHSFTQIVSQSAPTDNVLIVCHQENIKAFILHCVQESIESAREQRDLTHIKELETPDIKNCSLYQVRYHFDTQQFSFDGQVLSK